MIKLSMSKLYVLPVKLRVRLTISHLEQGKLHLSSGALEEHLRLHLILMCCSETREKKKTRMNIVNYWQSLFFFRLSEESALAREWQRRQARETRAVASLASRAFSHARGHFCLRDVPLHGLRKKKIDRSLPKPAVIQLQKEVSFTLYKNLRRLTNAQCKNLEKFPHWKTNEWLTNALWKLSKEKREFQNWLHFQLNKHFQPQKKRFITKSLHVLKPKGSGYEFVRYEIISRRSSKAKKAH